MPKHNDIYNSSFCLYRAASFVSIETRNYQNRVFQAKGLKFGDLLLLLCLVAWFLVLFGVIFVVDVIGCFVLFCFI